MKQTALAFLFFALSVLAHAQTVVPVKWNVEIKALEGANQYENNATASIAEGFKLYGMEMEGEGPVKTSFNFETRENCKKFGKPVEVTPSKRTHDNIFDTEVSYFKEEAVLSHKVWVMKKPARITGYIQWMSCNDDFCTPPTAEEFEFTID